MKRGILIGALLLCFATAAWGDDVGLGVAAFLAGWGLYVVFMLFIYVFVGAPVIILTWFLGRAILKPVVLQLGQINTRLARAQVTDVTELTNQINQVAQQLYELRQALEEAKRQRVGPGARV